MEALLTSNDPLESAGRRAIARWITQFSRQAEALTLEWEARRDEVESQKATPPGGTPYMEADSGSVDPEALEGGLL